MPITSFSGQNEFLSNFFNCPVEHDGRLFRCSEAAFQAAKRANESDKDCFINLNGAQAKRLGRAVRMRPNWDSVRRDVMLEILRDKFTRNTDLRQRLLATGEQTLDEGNWWRDTFWGVDLRTGEGLNHLGKILMQVRDEIKNEENNQ